VADVIGEDAEDLVDGKPAVFEADGGGGHVEQPDTGASFAPMRATA
jgi:hypothetical protein